MPKIDLTDLASLTNEQSAISSINANYATIETESDSFLSRDGTSPNQMEADLDMNSNRILNLPTPASDHEPARWVDIGDAPGYAEDAADSAAEAAASVVSAQAILDAVIAVQDDFDDIYLGSKASNPTEDNDGEALVEGQLYWNSTDNSLRIYDGSAWNAYSATALVGPASSVNNEIVLFDGTGGSALKSATTTGIVKATSGVISAAVSGTDYAPATSGSAILKGDGSGGFDDAVAGTDYYNPGGTDVAVADGGTGASTAAAARVNLNIQDTTAVGDANYSILSTDVSVITSASFTAARTWTLPSASSVNAGQKIEIIDSAAGITTTNTLTIQRAGSDTILDAVGGSSLTSIGLKTAREAITLMSDGGTKWHIVAWNKAQPFTSVEVFDSSGTFTPKVGVYRVRVQAWGGGGGSGGTNASVWGAGGGGGEYREDIVTVTPGTGVTVTVGAGGTAGTAAPGAGGTGGTSSFGSSVIAVGGTGSAAATGGINGGAGGTGGTGAIGVNGGQGQQNNYTSATTQAGAGGTTFGTPIAWSAASGRTPGGGAGGFPGTSSVGLAGGGGRVIVWY